MQSNTYTSFYADVLALTGNSSFTTTEQTRILANANRRLYQAYRSFSSWPRYIVGGELRPAVDSVISRDAIAGATYTISSATRSDSVVTITTSAAYAMFTGATVAVAGLAASYTISSATRSGRVVTVTTNQSQAMVSGATVTIAGLSGTVNANGSVVITTVSNTVFTYKVGSGTGSETYTGSGTVAYVSPSTDYVITEDSTTIFTITLDSGSGTETYTGSGTVVYDGIDEVDSFNRVFRDDPLNLKSSVEYEFYVDIDGAHVINNWDDSDTFWVGLYKEWSGPYTAASTDIPLEFYRFAVHATYADYLRFDGQIDKAMAEENNAQQYLMLEIDKAENQRNVNSLQRRISTYNSRQSR